jgi:hypothetical protein
MTEKHNGVGNLTVTQELFLLKNTDSFIGPTDELKVVEKLGLHS